MSLNKVVPPNSTVSPSTDTIFLFTLVFNKFVFVGDSTSLTAYNGSLQLKILDASTGAVLASSAIATKSSAAGLVLTANFSGTTAIGVKLVLEATVAVLPLGDPWPVYRPQATSCSVIYTQLA
jgi:hypothetical protein